MFLFCSRILSRILHCIYLLLLLSLWQSVRVPRYFLVFILTVLKSIDQLFFGQSLNSDYLFFFLMIGMRLCIFGNTVEMMLCSSQCKISSGSLSVTLITWLIWFLLSFIIIKLLSFPLC